MLQDCQKFSDLPHHSHLHWPVSKSCEHNMQGIQLVQEVQSRQTLHVLWLHQRRFSGGW